LFDKYEYFKKQQNRCRDAGNMVLQAFGKPQVQCMVYGMTDAAARAGIKPCKFEHAERGAPFGRVPEEKQQQCRSPKHRFQVFFMEVNCHAKQIKEEKPVFGWLLPVGG
jgi:hypothetical protein